MFYNKIPPPLLRNLCQRITQFLASILILVSIFGFLSFASSTITARAVESSPNFSLDESTVEQNNNLGYKFADRFDTKKAPLDKLKDDICGNPIDLTKNKYNPSVGASVLKTLSASCLGIKSNWVKLVFDNGLIAWVELAQITTVVSGNNIGNNLWQSPSSLGSIKANAQVSQVIKKSCSDFQYRIYDLSILNQYPNLDRDDDGVGCEKLPNKAGEGTSNDKYRFDFLSKNDVNVDDKISCSDFKKPLTDVEILAIYPSLDFDKDGIGCESLIPNSIGSDSDESDVLPDIELNNEKVQSQIDWSSLGLKLKDVLVIDLKALTGLDANCQGFDLGCVGVASFSGLGKQGLWMFKFITGVLQGAAQSIVGVLTQVWNLLTNAGGTINKIIEGFDKLINNPELLAKLFSDELGSIIKLDTFERANKIGRIIGSFIPDIIVGVATAGVGAVGLKALEAIGNSVQISSKVIAVSKFVGKTVKLLVEGVEVQLVKIGLKGFGLAGKEVRKLVTTLGNTEFEELLKKVSRTDQKKLLLDVRDINKRNNLLPNWTGEIHSHVFTDHSFTSFGDKNKFIKNANIQQLAQEAIIAWKNQPKIPSVSSNVFEQNEKIASQAVTVNMNKQVGWNSKLTTPRYKITMVFDNQGRLLTIYPK